MSRKEEKKRRLRVKNVVIDYYNDEELDYWRKLSHEEQVEVADLEKKILDMNNDGIPSRFKILQSKFDEKIKAIAIRKLDELGCIFPGSGEYHKINHYLQNLCRIPFGEYKTLPVERDNSIAIRDFIVNMKKSLDEKIYGHKDAKDQIIRLLAQWISNPESKGLVIGIQGSMGTGKTTLVKDAICKVLGLPFAFIPLGGISDGSFLTGHSYTYEGSTWGQIVENLMKCGCMNPVFFFDELDKVSCTHHGDEIINILIHMTDSTQNDSFHDKYFTSIDFDLSRSLIIFSYNEEGNIHPVLKDRMVKITTSGYTVADKITICHEHMIPTIMKEFNFHRDNIVFSNEIVKDIINKVSKEEGVRNLKRALYTIISNINLKYILDQEIVKFPYTVTDTDIKEFLPQKADNTSYNMMYL